MNPLDECPPAERSRRSVSFPLFRRSRHSGGAAIATPTTGSSESVSEPLRPKSSLRKTMGRMSLRSSGSKARQRARGDQERRDQPPSATIRTSILGSYEPLNVNNETNGFHDHIVEEKHDADLQLDQSYDATAVFQQMFVMCGRLDDVNDRVKKISRRRLSEDPTVEESFECVFASQLEAGLEHQDLWEDDDHIDPPRLSNLVSPALLQQSLGSARRQLTPTLPPPTRLTKPRKTFRTGTLVHIGTYDPVQDSLVTSLPTSLVPIKKPIANEKLPCRCHSGFVTPTLPTELWPQRPLLFRPTPGSGMRVKGVRFVNSTDYLWKTGEMNHTWVQALHRHWGRESPKMDLGCPECMILPINNGNEKQNESLVVDFSSDLFEGTVLLRLRHSAGSTPQPYDDNQGYFAGVNRQYQVVIQGRPRKELSLNDLMTGLQLERPCGKLPPKWILNSTVKLMSFFAPQMQTNLTGPRPMSISPLGSTPQLIRVNGDLDMEQKQEEPKVNEETVLGVASDAPTTLARAKFRKKALDKMFSSRSSEMPSLTPDNIYTFEFLQHLLSFAEFTLELGSMLGRIPLSDLLNGQALPVMAFNQDQKLWSFDIFHESLMEEALRYDQLMNDTK